jgi:hypothetical protein
MYVLPLELAYSLPTADWKQIFTYFPIICFKNLKLLSAENNFLN